VLTAAMFLRCKLAHMLSIELRPLRNAVFKAVPVKQPKVVRVS